MQTRTGDFGGLPRLRVPIVAAVLAIAASWQLGCSLEGKACTLIGCWNVVTLSGSIPSEASALAVQVCEGAVCQEVELDVAPERNGVAQEACIALRDPITGSFCALSTTSSVRRVRAQLDLRSEDETSYSLKIRDRISSETLLDESGVPTFTESYPNGKECDVTPCRSGTLDFE